jgi:hypothetical protein
MQSATGQFTASACHFVHWDNRGVGSPAIQLDAGKAIVQGCTFAQEGLNVQVGSNAVSAILTANQAPGGFRVDNQAGKRTQSGLNEEDAVTWTREGLSHYQVSVGREGDGRYLQGWYGPEGSSAGYRWSGPVSRLLLPVVPGEAYTIMLAVEVPARAITPEAGLYVAGTRIAPLQASNAITASVPPGPGDKARLEVRAGGWVPQQVIPGSGDRRTLGIQLSRVTMRSASAGTNVFNANTGTWLAPAPEIRKGASRPPFWLRGISSTKG